MIAIWDWVYCVTVLPKYLGIITPKGIRTLE